MDSRLTNLINDYQTRVREALTLMQRSGISMPYSSHEWIETDLSEVSVLVDGSSFIQHGAGCLVGLPAGEVDFDFGERGEIVGFDFWRLSRFAGDKYESYGFSKKEEIHVCFQKAVDEKFLKHSRHILYYIADAPIIYASSIDSRDKHDLLPHKDHDRVMTLQIHYFYAADLMRKNYESLSLEWTQNNKLSRAKKIKLRIYMNTWLGFLAVTCEGFKKKLKMRLLLLNERPIEFQELVAACDKLNSEMNDHSEQLRKFRNNVFHLRENLEDTLEFFKRGEDRLAWARSIHTGLDRFFSEYRVLCEFHYIIHGRVSESDPGLKQKKRITK